MIETIKINTTNLRSNQISKILRKFDEYFRFFCEYSVRQWYDFVVVQLRSGAVVQFTCLSGAVLEYLSGAKKLHHYEGKVLSSITLNRCRSVALYLRKSATLLNYHTSLVRPYSYFVTLQKVTFKGVTLKNVPD